MSEGFILVISLSLKEIPPLVISPFWTSKRPVIDLSTVVFPDPLLPSRATISPSFTLKEIPLKTKITSWYTTSKF
tara:strand:+ start:765 stop:989 length:225 start_codon:yes stop_codon:yes gene_type:complete